MKNITAEVSRGRAWIGDIGMGPVGNLKTRGAQSDLDFRWPAGEVHYCFKRSPLEPELDTTLAQETATEEAMAYIRRRVPSVSFVRHPYCWELDLPDVDDIVIVHRYLDDDGNPMDGARADGGRQGGAQYLELGGDTVGTIVHELSHTLGVYHEHQRLDRDSHVAICWDNARVEGDMVIKDEQMMLTEYDPHSRMHYRQDQNLRENPPMGGSCSGVSFYSVVPGVSFLANNNMTAEDINNLTQMYALPIGLPVKGEMVGEAITTGDYDADTYTDVAIGAPGRSANRGAVYLFKGALRYPAARRILTPPTSPAVVANTRFGAALATGDFNGDGFMDLAVGAPGSNHTGVTSGAVYIYFGGRLRGAVWTNPCTAEPGQPTSPCEGTDVDMLEHPDKVLTLGRNSFLPQPAAGDEFGASLLVGRFDDDLIDDLVIGAPGRANGTGAAYYFRGSMIGSTSGTQLYTFSTIAPSEFAVTPPATRFGASLAQGDFNGDDKRDLVVGAAGTYGRVFAFKGTGVGRPTAWLQVASPNASNDEFGFSVASGRLFGNDLRDELVVGAPRTLNGSGIRAGGIHVYTWVPASGPVGERFVHSDDLVTGTAAEVRFGHAVLPLNFDRAGQWEVAIGAPGYKSGAGRILMATSDGTTLAAGHEVVGSSFQGGLGKTLAAVVMSYGLFDTPAVSSTVRVLAGAPSSPGEPPFLNFTNAGQVVGFSPDPVTADFDSLMVLSPRYKAPSAN